MTSCMEKTQARCVHLLCFQTSAAPCLWCETVHVPLAQPPRPAFQHSIQVLPLSGRSGAWVLRRGAERDAGCSCGAHRGQRRVPAACLPPGPRSTLLRAAHLQAVRCPLSRRLHKPVAAFAGPGSGAAQACAILAGAHDENLCGRPAAHYLMPPRLWLSSCRTGNAQQVSCHSPAGLAGACCQPALL